MSAGGPDEETLARLADPLRAPAPPAWLGTRLTAAFQRRHGQLPPVRELDLVVTADSWDVARPAGLRRVGAAASGERTLHLRVPGADDEAHDDPEVVVDVRPRRDRVHLDLLVLHGRGLAYHARLTGAELVQDADHASADGRIAFRDVPAVPLELVLDDGHDRLRATLDLGHRDRP